ncbi:hypothetical protein CHUAL_001519 [Chamberlinius hualienensis]
MHYLVEVLLLKLVDFVVTNIRVTCAFDRFSSLLCSYNNSADNVNLSLDDQQQSSHRQILTTIEDMMKIEQDTENPQVMMHHNLFFVKKWLPETEPTVNFCI